MRTLSCIVGFLICFMMAVSPVHAAVTLVKDGDGYRVTTPSYTAKMGKDGLLSSIKLGEIELLGGKLGYGLVWHTNTPSPAGVLVQTDPRKLLAIFGVQPPREDPDNPKDAPEDVSATDLADTHPAITYTFDDNGLSLSVANKAKDYDSWIAVIASSRAQLLFNSGLPLLTGIKLSALVELTYDDGSTLTLTHTGPGNPFNDWENGGFSNYQWRRRLNPNSTYDFHLAFVKGKPGTHVLSAPPFQLTSTKPRNIFQIGDPLTFTITCKQEYFKKLDGVVPDAHFSYSVRDLWDRVVATDTFPATVNLDDEQTRIPFTVKSTARGWFTLDCTLRDTGGLLTPTTVTLYYAVITPTPGLANLPISADAGDYEMNGLLGLQCQRESISLKDLAPVDFTPKTKTKDDIGGDKELDPEELDDTAIKWDNLDAQVKQAVEHGKRYHVTSFWLLESLPNWLKNNPGKMEETVYQIVNRYKGQINNWMLVNEPNLTMGPDDYVKNYLTPLAKGAHRADPTARIMGPDCCGINPGWLDAVYKAGGRLDIVDMHPYTGHNRGWEEHGVPEAWQQVRTIMAEHGDGAKELWSTENGFDFNLGTFALKNVVGSVTRQFPLSESVGIARNHCYYYYTSEMGFINFFLADHRWLNPAGVAMRVENEQLAGKTYAGEVPIGRNKRAFRYVGTTEDVVMAWSLDFSTTATLQVLSKIMRIVDVMGNTVQDLSQASAMNTPVTLTLSGYPLYLHLDHGAVVVCTETLGPNLAARRYWATQKLQPTVTASSTAADSDATRVIDGVWNAENTGSYEGKVWCAQQSITESKDAWVEIDLPQARVINTAYLYAPSSWCGLPGIAACQLLVFDTHKQEWLVVAEVKNALLSWVFELKFPEITTDKVKVRITDLNNGWMMREKHPYTDMKPRITEIELFHAN